MYIKPFYSVSKMFRWTRRYIISFFFIALIPMILYDVFGFRWLNIPWIALSVIATALAFQVGFKNNASYDRMWEARKIWGEIVNYSRSFTAMVNDFISDEFSPMEHTQEDLFAIRKELVMRHVAWMISLRHNLRKKKPWESTYLNKLDQEYMKDVFVREYLFSLQYELNPYLSKEELQYVLNQRSSATACMKLQSQHIQRLKSQNMIDNFRHVEIQNIITQLIAQQGKSERIKEFPYPRQFATLNLFFVWTFILLLPFTLMPEFDEAGRKLLEHAEDVNFSFLEPFSQFMLEHFSWFSIPVTMIVSWIFISLERIGDVSENPFEGMSNDVPITMMSRNIEIDIRQMIDDDPNEIPEPFDVYEDTVM